MVLNCVDIFLKKLVLRERSPKVLALSFCFGVYVAFSPFIFLHTAMIIIASWLFSLNFTVALAVSLLINNPWTLIPVYTADYLFGELILSYLLRVDTLSINPEWMSGVNYFFHNHIGISGLSFWSFIIGGNLLGILISVMLYPIVRIVFRRISVKLPNLLKSTEN